MLSARQFRILTFFFFVLGAFSGSRAQAQTALLMEEPYGFFGILNPTGHNAIYFERICAETPVKLRRCQPGELGTVVARYQGIDGYDWVAIPLLPYLYAVENPADVPAHVDRKTVARLRSHYREAHLESLGDQLKPGNLWHGGWTQLVGAAYERRIYVFRFETSAEQDDALIAQLNAGPNRTSFNLPLNNCADFSRVILADEISPDSCRLWDTVTNEKLDKDRFRRDLAQHLSRRRLDLAQADHLEAGAVCAQAPGDRAHGLRDSAGSRLPAPQPFRQGRRRILHHHRLRHPHCDLESVSSRRPVCGLPGARLLSSRAQAPGGSGAGEAVGVDGAGSAHGEFRKSRGARGQLFVRRAESSRADPQRRLRRFRYGAAGGRSPIQRALGSAHTRPEPEMLYPAMAASHPCDRKKPQGWGTDLWGTAIMEPL